MAKTAYLGLGSNLGDRHAYLRAAREALGADPAIRVAAQSAIYETEAVAPEPQPPYLNAVLRVETDHELAGLMRACLALEKTLGRERPIGKTKAPRTIDIDLLLFEDAVVNEPGLTVPHPGLLERPFVRIPLADVAKSGLAHPISGEPLDTARRNPSVRRMGDF